MHRSGDPSSKNRRITTNHGPIIPAIGKAIQQLQGTDCNAHLQTVNALKMTPTLLQYGPIGNIINFLHFYQNHNTLDEVQKPTVRTMDSEYAIVEE